MVNTVLPTDHVPPVSAARVLSCTVPDTAVFIASLNVMTKLPLTAAPASVGVTDTTVGGVVSGALPVVKLLLMSAIIVLPATSWKPEMFTVWAVLNASPE